MINNNGSMIVQNRREGTDPNGVDEHKLEQMKEREGRVRMREALGFDANPPEYHEPAPSSKEIRGTAERRSKTTNREKEDRLKKYEELIGEFSDKQLEIFARSNFDPDREFGHNSQS